MMEDLHMTKQQFGLLASFFSLGYALMQVPSGMLAEKFGPRKMITIALVWWSAFTIFTGMIKHHGLLYLVRFLFGIGEAPMYPSNAVFNANWFSKDEKGRASSMLLAGSYFGPVLAPVITISYCKRVQLASCILHLRCCRYLNCNIMGNHCERLTRTTSYGK